MYEKFCAYPNVYAGKHARSVNIRGTMEKGWLAPSTHFAKVTKSSIFVCFGGVVLNFLRFVNSGYRSYLLPLV